MSPILPNSENTIKTYKYELQTNNSEYKGIFICDSWMLPEYFCMSYITREY